MYTVDSKGNWCVECEPIGEVYKSHAEAKHARELKAQARRAALKDRLYKASLVAIGALASGVILWAATL